MLDEVTGCSSTNKNSIMSNTRKKYIEKYNFLKFRYYNTKNYDYLRKMKSLFKRSK